LLHFVKVDFLHHVVVLESIITSFGCFLVDISNFGADIFGLLLDSSDVIVCLFEPDASFIF